jgi:galactokinase
MSSAAFEPDDLVDALVALEPDAAGRRSDIQVVRAPGRVNLIGEYTDINLGFVLPAAIDLEIRIAFLPTDDDRIDLTRLSDGSREVLGLSVERPRDGAWMDYVAGTAWALAEAGLPRRGLRGVIASTLPANAGLSSSAAIELASAWAMLPDPGSTDPMTLARICQRAENAYVGVKSGLMDQFASACGVAGSAVLLDCRSLAWRAVALPPDVTLVVLHTGSPRHLDGSAYNTRRSQCEAAVATIAADHPEIRSLRDVSPALLESSRDGMDAIAYRRASHVVSEDARVSATVAALATGDIEAVGEAFAASHASLRDQFEVVSPELDAMVQIARSVPGVLAARMTGAGFGGCTVNLVRPDAVDALRAAVERDYPARTGLTPRVLPVRAAAGAGHLR